MKTVRILIADDYGMVWKWLRIILGRNAGWIVCTEGACIRQAVENAKAPRPDVTVMDIGVNPLSGLEAIHEILKAAPTTRILILASYESDQVVCAR